MERTEHISQSDFVQQLKELVGEAPGGNCTITMRIGGADSDANIRVHGASQQVTSLKVCISRGNTRRIDTWRLKYLLAKALCNIVPGDKEFPDDRINDTFIAAIQTGKGSVAMTIQNGELTYAHHRLQSW